MELSEIALITPITTRTYLKKKTSKIKLKHSSSMVRKNRTIKNGGREYKMTKTRLTTNHFSYFVQ